MRTKAHIGELRNYPAQQDIDERAEEIDKISTDITSINQIYKDLSSIVSTQTPQVQQIEFNITETHERTNKAVQDLQQAEIYQRANPLTKILTVISTTGIGTAIGGPVGLIIGFKAGSIATAATAATGAVAGGFLGKTYYERKYDKITT